MPEEFRERGAPRWASGSGAAPSTLCTPTSPGADKDKKKPKRRASYDGRNEKPVRPAASGSDDDDSAFVPAPSGSPGRTRPSRAPAPRRGA